MRKLALALLAVVTTIAFVQAQEAVINSPVRTQIDEEHTKWIDHVMRSIATIKPGMTRKDLSGSSGRKADSPPARRKDTSTNIARSSR